MPLWIFKDFQGYGIKGAACYALDEVFAVLTQVRTFLYFINGICHTAKVHNLIVYQPLKYRKMKEKMIITAELSKNDVSAVFFLMGVELTDDMWEKLSERPISADLDQFDQTERQQVKFMLAALALSSIKDND